MGKQASVKYMHELDSTTAGFWTLLGAFGGIVKVLVQLLGMPKLPSKGNILWLLLANSFVSGFSGFMGAVLATQITPNDHIHVIAAGISGYLGVAALDMFSDWFRNRIKVPGETKKDNV